MLKKLIDFIFYIWDEQYIYVHTSLKNINLILSDTDNIEYPVSVGYNLSVKSYAICIVGEKQIIEFYIDNDLDENKVKIENAVDKEDYIFVELRRLLNE